MLLPETLGKPLTSTLEEAEALGRKKQDGLEMKQHEAKAWDAHCCDCEKSELLSEFLTLELFFCKVTTSVACLSRSVCVCVFA